MRKVAECCNFSWYDALQTDTCNSMWQGSEINIPERAQIRILVGKENFPDDAGHEVLKNSAKQNMTKKGKLRDCQNFYPYTE